MLKIKKIVILLIIILLLSACGKNCVKSHNIKSTCFRCQPIIVGKVASCIMVPYNCNKIVCDKYEDEGE